MFRSVFPGARRQLEYHINDCKGVDIAGVEPFRIQCKKTKKYVPLSTINEVQCDRSFGDVPVLIAAGDDQEPLACLPLPDFLKLVEAAHGGKRAAFVNCANCNEPVSEKEIKRWKGAQFCGHCYKRVKTQA